MQHQGQAALDILITLRKVGVASWLQYTWTHTHAHTCTQIHAYRHTHTQEHFRSLVLSAVIVMLSHSPHALSTIAANALNHCRVHFCLSKGYSCLYRMLRVLSLCVLCTTGHVRMYVCVCVCLSGYVYICVHCCVTVSMCMSIYIHTLCTYLACSNFREISHLRKWKHEYVCRLGRGYSGQEPFAKICTWITLPNGRSPNICLTKIWACTFVYVCMPCVLLFVCVHLRMHVRVRAHVCVPGYVSVCKFVDACARLWPLVDMVCLVEFLVAVTSWAVE